MYVVFFCAHNFQYRLEDSRSLDFTAVVIISRKLILFGPAAKFEKSNENFGKGKQNWQMWNRDQSSRFDGVS